MSAPGRPLLPWSFRSRTDDVALRPLEPADAAMLRLPWQSRFSAASLAAFLERHPGYGWIAPASGEFLLAEPWRRRDDVAGILEIHARRSRPALLARAATDVTAAGARALLLPDGEWTTASRVYEEQGFARVERVVYFQLLSLGVTPLVTRPLPPLEFAPLTPHHLATIVRLDHAAFPWLWWNSEAEFRSYVGQAGVQIWLGWMAGAPVAYAGFTTLDRWGHLDRLAVDPAAQGRSYGAAMLAFALARMAALNVTRVTLSTQEANTQSQRLYRGFGFRQTTERFDIYGKWLARGD